MANDERAGVREIFITILWLASGVLSWLLSIYLFFYVTAPLLIGFSRNVNTTIHSAFIRNAANLFYTTISISFLCFVFALLLSLFGRYTKIRLTLFVLGAVVFKFYAKILALINYMKLFPNLSPWASFGPEFISILFIVPLFSILGSRSGSFLKKRIPLRSPRGKTGAMQS